MQAFFAGPRARLRLPVARYWPASAALLLVVAIAAVAQVSLAPRHYTASQHLHIVVDTGTDTAAEANVQAEQVARDLSSPAFAASPQFAAATLANMPPRERDDSHVSVAALQTSMALSHSGADVDLSATWTTPAGATEILSAAAHALQTDSSLLPATDSDGEVIRLQTTTAATTATRSPGEADAAVQTLVQRLLLGALAALLLPFALAALLTQRTQTLGPA